MRTVHIVLSYHILFLPRSASNSQPSARRAVETRSACCGFLNPGHIDDDEKNGIIIMLYIKTEISSQNETHPVAIF